MIETSPAELRLFYLAKVSSANLQATSLDEVIARCITYLSTFLDYSQLCQVLHSASNYEKVENHLALFVEASNWNTREDYNFMEYYDYIPQIKSLVNKPKYAKLGWNTCYNKAIKTIVEIESNRIHARQLGCYFQVTKEGLIFGGIGLVNPISVEEWLASAPNKPTLKYWSQIGFETTEEILVELKSKAAKLNLLRNP